MKCMFEPFVIKEDNKNKAIRNPVLNSFFCGSLYSFPQVHHLLPVLGNRQPCLQLGAGGYQLCPACWKAHTVREEEPKEQASSTHCLNKLLALQEPHQLSQLVCWHKLPLLGFMGREAGKTRGKQRGGVRLTCADGQAVRLAI